MDGYDDSTYGDAFADIYDDWYTDINDVETVTTTLLELTAPGTILELGVGTGRIAIPLASAGRGRGVSVRGLDTSRAMLDRLTACDPHGSVDAVIGNMAGPLPPGPYELVFVAYNTLFNLTTRELQASCFHAVADALVDGGRFVVEAFVPDDSIAASNDVSIRTMATDRVVLSLSVRDPGRQLAEGQFVEFTSAGGIRLRPWSIRYSTPVELDAMAADAGLHVEHRWSSFAREPFGVDDERHVTVYRRG